MHISFLLYSTSRLKVDEDSSFWMMLELVARGHTVTYFESAHLFWRNGSVQAYVRKPRLHPGKGVLPSPLGPVPQDLSRLDALVIRKEPPFDSEYLNAMQLLLPLKNKIWMVNDPAGILAFNEKLSILRFPKWIAETVVTASPDEALRFARHIGGAVVVKPLDQKGGAGAFKISAKDARFHPSFYAATSGGSQPVMIQRFIPHRVLGDKRIVMLEEKVLGVVLRRPPRHDFRANLSLGATMHRSRLKPREAKIVAELAPVLVENGLYFVGLDVIAERYLSEINVTSPAGIPEIKQLYGRKPEKDFADFMERRLSPSYARKRWPK